ncbi:MAG: hypothetical protein M5R40_03825 [Anaerolineae bacterium]|nr:hypothetical protein [Anaerolineae bacterium]
MTRAARRASPSPAASRVRGARKRSQIWRAGGLRTATPPSRCALNISVWSPGSGCMCSRACCKGARRDTGGADSAKPFSGQAQSHWL